MEKYIRIIEDLICEFHQSGEKERYEQAKALEIILSLLGEIDNKEASDALHMLLHCALTNKDFETQKQQFQIVNAYIKQLEYKCETIFNKLIEYSKTTEKLQKETIWKSKVIEKIEEYNKREKEELKGMKGQDRYFVKQMYNYMRKSLEEFLESEE